MRFGSNQLAIRSHVLIKKRVCGDLTVFIYGRNLRLVFFAIWALNL